MEITLPQLFEIMTIHDPVTILEWYVQPEDIVEPGANLLKVRAPGRTITIPTPPELVRPHRVVEVASAEEGPLHLGDFLIRLEPVSEA